MRYVFGVFSKFPYAAEHFLSRRIVRAAPFKVPTLEMALAAKREQECRPVI